jgi:hypothetical protein
VNSASKFNSIVVKTLKPVLCSSRDSVPLKFKKQTWRQYSSSIGSFEPGFDPCEISLDNPFKTTFFLFKSDNLGIYGRK